MTLERDELPAKGSTQLGCQSESPTMKGVAAQTLWVVAAVIACAVVFYGLPGWVILQGYR